MKAVMPQTDIKLVECVLCGRVLSPIKEERRKKKEEYLRSKIKNTN